MFNRLIRSSGLKRQLYLMLVVLGIMLLSSVLPHASSQGGVIIACVNGENGNTRIVASADECRVPEYVIQWNISGPPGSPGPQGPPGANGLTTLVNVMPDGGGVCPYGGQKVEAGLDDNRDGACTARWTLRAHLQTPGQPGTNGLPGADGLTTLVNDARAQNCTYGGQRVERPDDNRDGVGVRRGRSRQYVRGAPGAQGLPGQPGADGYNTLVNLIPEAEGANCPAGGQHPERLDNGDGATIAHDGILQQGEVDFTRYVWRRQGCSSAAVWSVPAINHATRCYGECRVVHVGDDWR
jgi:hypothetical protein